MTLNEFVRKALTVPFLEKGRDYSGWDCWGLVYCAYWDIKDLALPAYLDYGSTREYEKLHALVESAKCFWEPAVIPAPMDVALFRISKYQTHVALMVDKRNALHAEQKIGTFIEPVDAAIWRKRLEGIYRYIAADGQNVGSLASFQSAAR